MRVIIFLTLVVMLLTSVGVLSQELPFTFSKSDSMKFFACQDYATQKLIPPRIFSFNFYIVLTGCSTQGHSVGVYKKLKGKIEEVYFDGGTWGDGFYSRVEVSKINNDSIPDFVFEYSFEDGLKDITALISDEQGYGKMKELLTFLPQIDYRHQPWPLKFYSTFEIYDIDHDGKDELVTEVFRIENKFVVWDSVSTIIELNK